MDRHIIVDTREKPKATINILCKLTSEGYTYELKKLDYGDYYTPDNPGIYIDRKQTIGELAKNVCTADSARFKREILRAKNDCTKLYILVEQNRYYDRGKWINVRDISDLLTWSSPHTKVTGERLYRVLASWQRKYPIYVVFCDKRQTGAKIIEILYGVKEHER